MNQQIRDTLIKKGVRIPNPESVYISDDIDPDRISGKDVTVHAGCKITGAKTLIQSGVTLGFEAPVTLDNTLVGKNSRLAGGFFQGAVFLGDNVFGSGAHVRKGTILEEEANAAHTVGLKQTILFPFVTLGSLINFCDCFMAGGTSRKDHSEVGSSFIHFNYTPNQDKATASMMGNVYQGVMLDQPPVFLGGQGGLVGPLRIAFGCVTAAGCVIRKSENRNNRLILGGSLKEVSLPRRPGVYTKVESLVKTNIAYIAGLLALSAWYRHIRSLFVRNPLAENLLQGLCENLSACIDERIKRLAQLGEKLALSKEILQSKKDRNDNIVATHTAAINRIQKAEGYLADIPSKISGKDLLTRDAEQLIRSVEEGIKRHGNHYVTVIQTLDDPAKDAGRLWLYGIEKEIIDALSIS